MLLSPLKGSRRTVRKRILALSVIAFIVPLYLIASGHISFGNAAQAKQSELYTIDRGILFAITNKPDAVLTGSADGVPYYIVTSSGNGK